MASDWPLLTSSRCSEVAVNTGLTVFSKVFSSEVLNIRNDLTNLVYNLFNFVIQILWNCRALNCDFNFFLCFFCNCATKRIEWVTLFHRTRISPHSQFPRPSDASSINLHSNSNSLLLLLMSFNFYLFFLFADHINVFKFEKSCWGKFLYRPNILKLEIIFENKVYMLLLVEDFK